MLAFKPSKKMFWAVASGCHFDFYCYDDSQLRSSSANQIASFQNWNERYENSHSGVVLSSLLGKKCQNHKWAERSRELSYARLLVYRPRSKSRPKLRLLFLIRPWDSMWLLSFFFFFFTFLFRKSEKKVTRYVTGKQQKNAIKSINKRDIQPTLHEIFRPTHTSKLYNYLVYCAYVKRKSKNYKSVTFVHTLSGKWR